jgi:hypothetical protein
LRRNSQSPGESKLRENSNESGKTRTTKAGTSKGKLSNIHSKVGISSGPGQIEVSTMN